MVGKDEGSQNDLKTKDSWTPNVCYYITSPRAQFELNYEKCRNYDRARNLASKVMSR
jgi:hypothetical protein